MLDVPSADEDMRSDALPTRPSVAVSRAVQQLLERHGLAGVSRSNGNVVQVNNNCLSGSAAGTGDFESDFEPRIRPDPIGSSYNPSDADILNGNTSNLNGDEETEELSKLRCQSVRTEVLAEKFRRKNRCADYPGFGFASSVFSSDTMMKFSIIKNELHNIMNNQLKRVSLLFIIYIYFFYLWFTDFRPITTRKKNRHPYK